MDIIYFRNPIDRIYLIDDTSAGSGGCTAHALVILGVYPSVDAAKTALDREGAAELVRRLQKHGQAYNATKVYVLGDKWCDVVIKATAGCDTSMLVSQPVLDI
jgi:hypothetical protein